MTAVAFGPTSCSSCLVPVSKLPHHPEASTVLFQNTAIMVEKTPLRYAPLKKGCALRKWFFSAKREVFSFKVLEPR